ncbi:MAG: LytTR family DNA-binding domain-containing protein [Bacteroidota bacterium]
MPEPISELQEGPAPPIEGLPDGAAWVPTDALTLDEEQSHGTWRWHVVFWGIFALWVFMGELRSEHLVRDLKYFSFDYGFHLLVAYIHLVFAFPLARRKQYGQYAAAVVALIILRMFVNNGDELTHIMSVGEHIPWAWHDALHVALLCAILSAIAVFIEQSARYAHDPRRQANPVRLTQTSAHALPNTAPLGTAPLGTAPLGTAPLGNNAVIENDVPSEPDAALFVSTEEGSERIDLDDLRYAEAWGNYVRLHLPGRVVLTKGPLYNVARTLPDAAFVRVHRSYVVAVEHIERVTSTAVVVEGQEIPVSKRLRASVLDRLGLA